MRLKGRLSRRAIAALSGVCVLMAGTVAAQSVDNPWWVDTGIAEAGDVVTTDGSVAIGSLAFSGSLAKAKANYPETGEYIGCSMTSLPDNGQFLRCVARTAAGQTISCENIFIGSSLDLRQTLMLTAAQSISADSYILVAHGGDGEPCQALMVSNSSADFLVNEGGGADGVETCTIENSTNLGRFSGSAVSVPNNGCAVITQFAKPFFKYGPNRTMQLQNPGGTTSYPVPYEYAQSCTGAGGAGSFDAVWDDQFLPGINDTCPLFIKLQGNGTGTLSLKYF